MDGRIQKDGDNYPIEFRFLSFGELADFVNSDSRNSDPDFGMDCLLASFWAGDFEGQSETLKKLDGCYFDFGGHRFTHFAVYNLQPHPDPNSEEKTYPALVDRQTAFNLLEYQKLLPSGVWKAYLDLEFPYLDGKPVFTNADPEQREVLFAILKSIPFYHYSTDGQQILRRKLFGTPFLFAAWILERGLNFEAFGGRFMQRADYHLLTKILGIAATAAKTEKFETWDDLTCSPEKSGVFG